MARALRFRLERFFFTMLCPYKSTFQVLVTAHGIIWGVNGYLGTRLHRIIQVTKLRMATHESSSKVVHIATCMVPQLRLINAWVISLHLIIIEGCSRQQQWKSMLINSSWRREEESRPMGSQVRITRLGDMNMF
jgi:hypothetical protein